MANSMRSFLEHTVKLGASDLHLAPGAPPMVRINGHLSRLEGFSLIQVGDVAEMLREILPEKHYQALVEGGEQDFSFSEPSTGRFRGNAFLAQGQLHAVIRVIQKDIPSLTELGLPVIVATLLNRKKGLLLVTGPAGSGKSTTLASMVAAINNSQALHILTLEDPIEFLHPSNKSIVHQREIGTDSKSFATALRAALRQDPDVIMVGEMRDVETISTAVTAAETGHLVLATLHTMDAVHSIERILDSYPGEQQAQIRAQLSGSLLGVVSQQLLQKKGGGRILATEVLTVNAAVRNIIRQGKLYQMYTLMQISSHLGMSTMDHGIKKLYTGGLITRKEALENCLEPQEMEKALTQNFGVK